MKIAAVIIFLFVANCSQSQSLYQYYVSEASSLIMEGEYDKATYFLDKGIRRYPDSTQLFMIRAYNYHSLELADSSISDLLRARELDSKNVYISRFLGLNYEEKGDYAKAEINYLEFFRKCA